MSSRLYQLVAAMHVLVLSCFLGRASEVDRKLQLLEAYGKNKEWIALKRGLEELLDKDDIAYSQLCSVLDNEPRPLWWVGYDGHYELAEQLASGGQGANLVDSSGNTLLSGAAYGGHLKLVRMLLDCGAHVDAKAGRYSSPAIVLAAWGSHLDIMALLKERQADVNASEQGNATGLHAAAYKNNVTVLEFLVLSEARTTTRDWRGDTPLDVAKKKGSNEAVRYLLNFPH